MPVRRGKQTDFRVRVRRDFNTPSSVPVFTNFPKNTLQTGWLLLHLMRDERTEALPLLAWCLLGLTLTAMAGFLKGEYRPETFLDRLKNHKRHCNTAVSVCFFAIFDFGRYPAAATYNNYPI